MRLVIDAPRSAPLNMAIDEVLFESQKNPGAEPVLRIYFWLRPSYSIGYFQSVSDFAGMTPVVRRITGGGLVRHGTDITFSLALKNPNPFLPGDTKSSYLKINEVLLAAFKPFFQRLDYADCKTIPSGRAKKERICFESPACYDLMLDGKKVVGASQRRSKGSMLHQSSIFLPGDPSRLVTTIRQAFEEKWRVPLVEAPLTEQELEKAKDVEASRYRLPDWSL